MVLVLFLLGIIVFFIILFILIILSRFKINIKKLKANVNLVQKVNYDYDILFGIYLLNKIPLLKIKINPIKIKKSRLIGKIKKYRKNKEFKIDTKTIKNIVKVLSPKMEELNLDLTISTDNAVYTSFAISLISTLISILIPYIIDRGCYKKIRYNVNPVYNGKNEININLNSIIYVKMVHIISVIYIVLRKRSVDKNGRTSNRGAYAHSYE